MPIDIKFEDLFTVCEKCCGEGNLTESVRPSSGGFGRVVYSQAGSCDACGGTGGQLTESGRSIKKLFLKLETRRV